jgi:quinol-cytochrome oxidoreductase complex cytochrome b subunit
MEDAIERSLARDIGLFLVLVVLAGLLFPVGVGATALTGTFYLALFIHIGFSIYIGEFTGWRTVTWLLMIGAWVVSELAAFLSFLLPWGQIWFWLAQLSVIGALMNAWQATGYDFRIVLALAMLLIDLAVMHQVTWHQRSWRWIVMFLAAVGVSAVACGYASGLLMTHLFSLPDLPTEDTLQIISPWYLLPFYALLRAVESKLGGLVLMFGAMLAPAIVPWMRTEALRRGRVGSLWLCACLVLALVWTGLGYLGSRPVDEPEVIYLVPVLALLYFAFFLVVPIALGKSALRSVA